MNEIIDDYHVQKHIKYLTQTPTTAQAELILIKGFIKDLIEGNIKHNLYIHTVEGIDK